ASRKWAEIRAIRSMPGLSHAGETAGLPALPASVSAVTGRNARVAGRLDQGSSGFGNDSVLGAFPGGRKGRGDAFPRLACPPQALNLGTAPARRRRAVSSGAGRRRRTPARRNG